MPANEACVVHGGQIDNALLLNCAGAVVFASVRMGDPQIFHSATMIDACTGPVVWQACGGLTSSLFFGVLVTNSSQVSLLHCGPLTGIQATNSNLNVVDVQVLRDPSMPGAGGLGLFGGRASVAGGTFEGRWMGGAPYSEPGIEVYQQGHLVVTGGAVARITQWAPPSPPISAIRITSGSVWIDPSVVSIGTTGAPPVGGTGTVTALPIPSLVPAHTPASNTFQLAFAAEPGAVVFTLLGLPQPVLPLPFGDVWLDPASLILSIQTMSPAGTATHTGSFANVPPYLVLVAQSAALTPAGDIALGVPARFVWD